MKSYFSFIEKKLLSIIEGKAEFAPSSALVTLFLAAHPLAANVARYCIDTSELEQTVLSELERSTHHPAPYSAQLLVLDRSMSHYFAVHAQFDNGTTKLLVIDYYAGFQCDLSHFNESALSQSPNVELFIAGGDELQTDSISCAFFAIAALDAAEKIPDLFDHAARHRKPHSNQIVWQDLPVELVWNAQSMQYIWRHIDHLRQTHFADLPPDQDIPVLAHPGPRQEKSFADYLSRGIMLKENSEKVVNRSVRLMVAKPIAEAALRLLYDLSEDEPALLRLLYQDKYPLVYSLTLTLFHDYSAQHGLHPIAEKIFSNPDKFEIGLRNKKLHEILNHPIIQELTLNVSMRENILRRCFVSDPSTVGEIQENIVNQIAMLLLIGEPLRHIDEACFDRLVASKTIASVLQHPELLRFIQAGLLPLQDALFVIPSKIIPAIWETLSEKDDTEKIRFLKGSIVSPNHPDHAPTQAHNLTVAMAPIMRGYSSYGIARPRFTQGRRSAAASSVEKRDEEASASGAHEPM